MPDDARSSPIHKSIPYDDSTPEVSSLEKARASTYNRSQQALCLRFKGPGTTPPTPKETLMSSASTGRTSHDQQTSPMIKDAYPPGPRSFLHLGIGLARQMLRDPVGSLMELHREFGPAFTVRLLGTRQVWLIGPEANTTILLKNHKNFSWGEGHMGDLIPLLGHGLLTTDGEVHDRARRLMQSLFRREQLTRYAEEMGHYAKRAVAQLKPGQPLRIEEWAKSLALEIATHILFGMDTRPSDCEELGHQFEEALQFYGAFYHLQFLRGPWSPWARMQKARKKLDKVIFTEIKRRRDRGSNGDNLVDLLVNAKEGSDTFTDQEIRDQLITLLFAGHDTTTATISWLISLLGQAPAPYEKMRKELKSFFAQQGDTPLNMALPETKAKLPYFEQVIAETLRLRPTAWIGPRRAIESFEIYGYRIPGGTNVAYSSWLTHHMPEYYPNPTVFDPDRMTPAFIKSLPAGAYVPFGWGPRMCIGKQFGELEIKTIAAAMHEGLSYELVPGQDFTAHAMPTSSPREGVKVIVREG